MSKLPDGELIRRIELGEVEAYGLLVRRYERLVFAVAFHILGNVEDARDICQDVFVRAFTRLGQLRDASRIGSWLRQIAANECRAWLAKHPQTVPLFDQADPGNPFRELESSLMLQAYLQNLDEASRLTAILFYQHTYSLAEIGRFLDEPVTTIKSRLRNIRAKLRKELETTLETSLSQESLPEDFSERVTQIITAVKDGDEAMIRVLLAADPRLVGVTEEPSRQTPLHIAAGSGRASLVELLLANGADPNALDRGDNAAPIHYACERGWLECVRLLAEAGADIDSDYNVHQRSPLGWACIFGTVQTEVAEYLLSRGATLDLFSAIALDKHAEIREMVKENPFVLRQRMSRCELSQSPIEFACGLRRFDIGNLLVELGSELSLSEAAGLGIHKVVANRLSESPGEFVVRCALKCAVRAGQVATARLLLEHGADPNYAPQGTSLLFDSIAANDEATSRLLLEFGADLEFKDAHWQSNPLGWQVFYGNPATTKLALKLGSVVSEHLIELATSGEKGDLRRWSSGTPEGFREVRRLLEER